MKIKTKISTFLAFVMTMSALPFVASDFSEDAVRAENFETVAVARGTYEDRRYDVHSDIVLFGNTSSEAYFVNDGGETYLDLKWNGTSLSTDMSVWIQPGYLPADTYTVKAEIEVVGFSVSDCLAFKFNGQEPSATIYNLDEYNALENAETSGRKIASYTVETAATEWPAMQIWFYHKCQAGIEAKVYSITYYNSQGEVAYFNDFSEPFSTYNRINVPYGYENKTYGGLYSDYEGDFNIGTAQLVREKKLDGSVETYARLYDADTVSMKDSINLWVQPGTLPAGNYKTVVELEITDNVTDYMRMFIAKDRPAYGEIAANVVATNVEVYNFNRTGKVEFTYTLTEEEPHNALNFWFQHKNQPNVELRIYSITYTNTDTNEVVYFNDFSTPFEQADFEKETFQMIDGAQVRMANPTGLRFSALYAKANADAWKAKGYEVEMGMLIAPTQFITAEKGALTLENTNYVLDKDYKKIVCEECSVFDGNYRINGVLKVAENHYDVAFTGIAYVKITKNGVSMYKYATGTENSRSIKAVASAALEANKANATLSAQQVAVLEKIVG